MKHVVIKMAVCCCAFGFLLYVPFSARGQSASESATFDGLSGAMDPSSGAGVGPSLDKMYTGADARGKNADIDRAPEAGPGSPPAKDAGPASPPVREPEFRHEPKPEEFCKDHPDDDICKAFCKDHPDNERCKPKPPAPKPDPPPKPDIKPFITLGVVVFTCLLVLLLIFF
jgi:hypothetical protein